MLPAFVKKKKKKLHQSQVVVGLWKDTSVGAMANMGQPGVLRKIPNNYRVLSQTQWHITSASVIHLWCPKGTSVLLYRGPSVAIPLNLTKYSQCVSEAVCSSSYHSFFVEGPSENAVQFDAVPCSINEAIIPHHTALRLWPLPSVHSPPMDMYACSQICLRGCVFLCACVCALRVKPDS